MAFLRLFLWLGSLELVLSRCNGSGPLGLPCLLLWPIEGWAQKRILEEPTWRRATAYKRGTATLSKTRQKTGREQSYDTQILAADIRTYTDPPRME
ncbi:hypothetical protein F5883DRAFT_36324 [Diaporthe sp. PMI_573]|nr:hypothetical protein F5883DRAFT_36324 [Diaporthaceae sp. PMI_573]